MDLNASLKKIIEKKSVFFVIVVILGFLIGAVVIWGAFSSKMLSYQHQIAQKKEKSLVIEEHNKMQKKFEEYAKTFSKPLTPDALSNQIAEYAAQNRLDIDINPQSPKKFDNYIATSIRLNIRSKKFNDIVSFIQMMESSPFSFKIDSWSGRMEDPVSKEISCDMNVTSVQVIK